MAAAAAGSSVWLLQQHLLPPHNNSLLPTKSSSHPFRFSACPPPPPRVHNNKTAAGRGNLLRTCCSSASSSSSSSSEPGVFLSYKDDPNFRGCKGCGRDEPEPGCNGEGRIQGGIAAVPGFSWWPIKAYRPCPGFLASGGRYRRQGQSMDDVASGTARPNKQKQPPPSSSNTNNKSAK